MPEDPPPDQPKAKSGVRRTKGSIEDRIQAARAKREALSSGPQVAAPPPRMPASATPAPQTTLKKRQPLLLYMLLIGLIAALGWVAVLPPVPPLISDEPPNAFSLAFDFPPDQASQDEPPRVPAIRTQSFRLALAPVMPLAFPVDDPAVDGTPPRRAPQPPTPAAPDRSERPATRP